MPEPPLERGEPARLTPVRGDRSRLCGRGHDSSAPEALDG
jgi:hypothetical protein